MRGERITGVEVATAFDLRSGMVEWYGNGIIGHDFFGAKQSTLTSELWRKSNAE
jgi:hypothetical protein